MNTTIRDGMSKLHANTGFSRVVLCLIGLMVFSGATAYGQTRYASRLGDEEDEQTAHLSPTAQQYTRLSLLERLPTKLRETISLHLTEVSLEEALLRIARKADLKLVYGQLATAVGRRVTLDRKAISAAEAFEITLRGTGLGLMLSYTGRLIVVEQPEVKMEPQSTIDLHLEPVKLSAATLPPLRPPVQTGTIAGMVTDSTTGEPPGVNVVIAGTRRGAATGADGRFAISDLEGGPTTWSFPSSAILPRRSTA